MKNDLYALQKAMEIATSAHEGQLDKGGTPYIYHPLTVAMLCDTIEEKITAVLHDVVEDTEMTLNDLDIQGFDKTIIRAVDAITKRKDEDYPDYLHRVKSNPIAKGVKLRDIEHNLQTWRLSNTPNYYSFTDKLTKKYAVAKAFLEKE